LGAYIFSRYNLSDPRPSQNLSPHNPKFPVFNLDKPAKSQKTPVFVIPAKAGIQETQPLVDSRFRESDGLRDFYETINLQ